MEREVPIEKWPVDFEPPASWPFRFKRQADKKRFEVLDRAIEKGWFINPGKGMETFIENVILIHRCPCDPSRPDCPCPEAEAEVTEKGRCKCGLYWRDYKAFKATLKPLEEKQKLQ